MPRKSPRRSPKKSTKRSPMRSPKKSTKRSPKRSTKRSPKRRSPKKSTKKSSGKLKLLKVSKSPNSKKKLRAYFSDGTHTDFGAAGYSDYTIHKDPERKQRYINRHKRHENWSNLKSPGALSRYVLWNKPSLKASIADYKKKFK
jgi:hypothetical protein